jgi:DNA-binding NarL/FixJ family response regulator
VPYWAVSETLAVTSDEYSRSGKELPKLTTTRLVHQTPTTANAPRLLVVEDHPLFRAALIDVIRMTFPGAEVLQATSIGGALDVLAGGEAIDVVLLDLSMPGTTGLLGALRVRIAAPRSALVIVSAHEDSRIVGSAMALGITGYIPKSTSKDELARFIRSILDGAVCVPRSLLEAPAAKRARADAQVILRELGALTPQQLCVLDMICRGLQNKQIAHELNIAITTVKVHVTEVLRKLHVRSRTEAIVKVSALDFNQAENADPRSTKSRG